MVSYCQARLGRAHHIFQVLGPARSGPPAHDMPRYGLVTRCISRKCRTWIEVRESLCSKLWREMRPYEDCNLPVSQNRDVVSYLVRSRTRRCFCCCCCCLVLDIGCRRRRNSRTALPAIDVPGIYSGMRRKRRVPVVYVL